MVSWLLALWLGAGLAHSAEYYVEGPMLDARRDATTMSRAASDLGYRARVVRRFAQGSGWRFVLVMEGFEGEDEAGDAAAKVAEAVGRELTLFSQEEGEATRLRSYAGEADVESDTEDGSSNTFDEDVGTVLARAAVAHGGDRHPVSTKDAVLFRFRRTLPSGLVAEHTVARRGRDLYVQVDIEAGEGRSSRAWILGDQAWLSVEGGPAEPKDAVWSREQLDRFLPERVIGLPLRFGEVSTTRREFQLLYADGTARSGRIRSLVLKYDGDQVSSSMELYLEEDNLLTRRFVTGADASNYDDYRDVAPGAVAPFHILLTREGETVDEVHVLDLDLEPQLDEAWFSAPE